MHVSGWRHTREPGAGSQGGGEAPGVSRAAARSRFPSRRPRSGPPFLGPRGIACPGTGVTSRFWQQRAHSGRIRVVQCTKAPSGGVERNGGRDGGAAGRPLPGSAPHDARPLFLDDIPSVLSSGDSRKPSDFSDPPPPHHFLSPVFRPMSWLQDGAGQGVSAGFPGRRNLRNSVGTAFPESPGPGSAPETRHTAPGTVPVLPPGPRAPRARADGHHPLGTAFFRHEGGRRRLPA